jgi:hypothetical protein
VYFCSPFTLLTMNDKAICLVKATKPFLILFNHKDVSFLTIPNSSKLFQFQKSAFSIQAFKRFSSGQGWQWISNQFRERT